MVACQDDDCSIPQVAFNFVPISQLSNIDKDALIGIIHHIFLSSYFLNCFFFVTDVIGVAKSASEVSTITTKTTNKELKKREVHLVDDTNTEVLLWSF